MSLSGGEKEEWTDLDRFKEEVYQEDNAQQAWYARQQALLLLPQAQIALARGLADDADLREFQRLCGEVVLYENEAKKWEVLKPWAHGIVAAYDFSSDAVAHTLLTNFLEECRKARADFDQKWGRV